MKKILSLIPDGDVIIPVMGTAFVGMLLIKLLFTAPVLLYFAVPLMLMAVLINFASAISAAREAKQKKEFEELDQLDRLHKEHLN